jgi:hypothetical protein
VGALVLAAVPEDETTRRRDVGDAEAFDHSDLPTLVDRLDHEDADVRGDAIWRIAELAATDPAAVERHVDDVVACASDSDVWVRRGATWAAEELVEASPELSKSSIETLFDALDDDDALVRENAIVGAASVAANYPRVAADHLDELRELAESADETRLSRYAAEALEGIREGLQNDAPDGASIDIRPGAATADPSWSATVFETTDDERDHGRGTETGSTPDTDASAGDERARAADESASRASRDVGPPETVPDVGATTVSLADVEIDDRLQSGPLLDVYRGHAEPASEQRLLPVELHRFERTALEFEDAARVADATRDAMERWSRIDDHETVVTTLGHGDDPPWLVTEPTTERSFEKFAIGSEFTESLYYATCLVRAVAYAHSKDVLHGGLSPRAVGVVDPVEDAWPVPKVGDWGFAAVVVEHRGSLPVHPAYAAPEQIAPRTLGYPRQKTDVYGLGALLYTLFAGRPPLDRDVKTNASRIRALEHGASPPDEFPEPPPPSTYDSAVPSGVDGLVGRALAPDPMDRYETVLDLERELEALVDAHAGWS